MFSGVVDMELFPEIGLIHSSVFIVNFECLSH